MQYIPDIDNIAKKMEGEDAQEVLRWALDNYHPKIALASSFGAEDVVIIDMLMKIRKDVTIFTLDTGRLNQETYDVMDKIREKYGIEIAVYFPDQSDVEEMVKKYGMNLFYKSIEYRKLCCEIRKVRPLKRALDNLDAWITGLRREQTDRRSNVMKIEVDAAHNNIIKVNPLVDWTWDMVWGYIRENNVPYNTLHDKGYPSIGCEPCTRAIRRGEPFRAGRWWWEDGTYKECGLHFTPLKK